MAETQVTLNQSVTAGAAVAGWTDTSNRVHQEVVIQTQTSASDPVSVSASNPLPVTGVVTGNVADGSVDSGNGVKVAGVYNSSPITLSSGQRGSAQLDANGFLKVNIAAGQNAGGTSSVVGAANPGSGTLALFSAPGSVTAAAAVDASGNLKVNIAAGGVPAGQDNATYTAGTTNGLPAFGVFSDSIGALSSGNQGALRLTADRKLYVAMGSSVSGGWTPFAYIAAATPAAQQVKASAGQIGYMHVTNSDTNWVWLKVFSASPTLGTTVPVQSYGVPPGGGFTLPAPITVGGTAIYIAVTGGISLTDNTSVTASKTSVNLGYA